MNFFSNTLNPAPEQNLPPEDVQLARTYQVAMRDYLATRSAEPDAEAEAQARSAERAHAEWVQAQPLDEFIVSLACNIDARVRARIAAESSKLQALVESAKRVEQKAKEVLTSDAGKLLAERDAWRIHAQGLEEHRDSLVKQLAATQDAANKMREILQGERNHAHNCLADLQRRFDSIREELIVWQTGKPVRYRAKPAAKKRTRKTRR